MRQIIKRQKQEKEQVTGSDFVRRDVTVKIDVYLQQDIIKVVTGVRRCGKSIFCFMVLRGTKGLPRNKLTILLTKSAYISSWMI